MADEEAEKGYTWETEYEKTWEAIQEDGEGSLQASVDDIVHRAKRRKMLERPINVKLGMMRHLFVAVDMSIAMEDQDLKPNRLRASLKLLEHFVEEFFDRNPIGQLGILSTRNKRAQKLTELSGNPKRHISMLQSQREVECLGEASLQNTLEVAMQTLKNLPGHASREVLIVFGSLTTCDPGDIHDTIKRLQNNNIRCSVIGLAAEVQICKKVCQETKGTYDVILDENHLRDLLTQHVMPPPATLQTEASLIKMGFPHHQLKGDRDTGEQPSMCLCHLDDKTGQTLSTKGYFCPQCKSKYCELPVECKACGLTLVSAPHLARSYHHLFPLAAFTELEASTAGEDKYCSACQQLLKDPALYQCGKCQNIFCIDCDIFVHETLHSCPGCATSRSTQQVEAAYTS